MSENSKILITGSTGLIGRAVASLLRREGKKIVTVGRNEACDYRIDLYKEGTDLDKKISKPSLVIHLAAAVPSKKEISDSMETFQITNTMDRNILTAGRKWNCPVIYASGCSLYEKKGHKILNEKEPLQTNMTSYYLRAKKAGDEAFGSYEQGMVLRIPCPAGRGISDMSVMGLFLGQIEKVGEINVYGAGTREQDFIDIRDIARAISRIATCKISGVFNIASGIPTTMKLLADTIVALCGVGRVVTGRQADPLEGATARYSIGKAERLLKWSPQYSLEETIMWIRSTQP